MDERKVNESLNKLIAKTAIYGADDLGGPYGSNWQDMKTAIYQFLSMIGIDGENYMLIENAYEKGNGIWYLPYLVRKTENKMA